MNSLYQAEKRPRRLPNEFEFLGPRLHQFKMSGILQRDEFGVVAPELRGVNVPFADVEWNTRIGGPMKQPLRDAEGKVLNRGRGLIAIGYLVWASTEEIGDDGSAQVQFIRPAKVQNAGQADR